MRWDLRHGELRFGASPIVMGVLNVTPDSFSDGGLHLTSEDAIRRADAIVDEGAGIIDIGAESTRPGSAAVPEDVQIERIDDILSEVRRRHPRIPISIDTRSAAVAGAAIERGADIVNDVSALRHDEKLLDVLRETSTPVVLMHMRGTPESMQRGIGEDAYDDVVGEVTSFLKDRAAYAESTGIPRERVAIDPGIGFGKTTHHNLALLKGLASLAAIGYPVLVGASRKRFIGEILDREAPADRLAGSLACAVAAVLGGAHVIRAHDVRATVDAVKVAAAIHRRRT